MWHINYGQQFFPQNMSTGLNYKAILIIIVIAAIIVTVICPHGEEKSAVPVISSQEVASDGYASGYRDCSMSDTLHATYEDSLYRLAGVIGQYDSAYQEGYRKGFAVYNELVAKERNIGYLKLTAKLMFGNDLVFLWLRRDFCINSQNLLSVNLMRIDPIETNRPSVYVQPACKLITLNAQHHILPVRFTAVRNA